MYYLEIISKKDYHGMHDQVNTSYSRLSELLNSISDSGDLLDNFMKDEYFIQIRYCEE